MKYDVIIYIFLLYIYIFDYKWLQPKTHKDQLDKVESFKNPSLANPIHQPYL